ncbi:hypothetical protein D3P07_06355 [Paenibacillus sp. 1011MAR3C5]|uniref:hypothetical protein n=1 Tax=Paenibacillus sp. 1011MAR3C5 TaxID=1675787 RepID=UPI000E6C092C|nr:hypothetical protein [Paenibacillus sp. 1011MAR3C5]RJE89844.1 hypothetical protein D3P07_06355 [Paenibacillus sp. 1011MAR3C5]
MRRIIIVLAGVVSILAGLAYIGTTWLAADFLGPEVGSEREPVRFWGICSIVIGALLLGVLAVRTWMKEALNDGMLISVLAAIFLIQIPPFGLWMLGFIASGYTAFIGMLLHGALMAMVCLTFVFARRSLSRETA